MTRAVVILILALVGCSGDFGGPPPADVTAVAQSPTSVLVEWRPVMADTLHRVYFSTSEADLGSEFRAAPATETSLVFDNLSPFTTYFFFVRSFQPILGESRSSEIVSVTTPPGPLQAAFGLNVAGSSPTSLTIAWQSNDPVVDAFRVLIRGPTDQDFSLAATVSSDVFQAEITGLEIVTSYDFQVVSVRGNTTVESPVFTTATDRPEGVGIIQVHPLRGEVNPAVPFPVTLRGWGFTIATPTVFFGDRMATNVIVVDDRTLSCIAPDGAAGPVPIRVVVDGLEGTAPAPFRYVASTGSDLSVALAEDAIVSFDDRIGTTTVAAVFIVRDVVGRPVRANDVRTRLFVTTEDGEQELGVSNAFNESLLNEDAEELAQSVYLFLTLDASFSLVTQFQPEQFTPMLSQARALLQSGVDIWGNDFEDGKLGEFRSNVAWFRELIETARGGIRPNQVTSIPIPIAGNETKLNAAVSYQLQTSVAARNEGLVTGPLDRHIVVLFTDGQDTLSWFSNDDETFPDGMLNDRTPTHRFGWQRTTLEDLFTQIANHPLYPENLEVFTVFLGDEELDTTELEQLAQVGLGRFFQEDNDVVRLFDRLAVEITERLSRGARIAIEPGEYQFRVGVERISTGDTADLAFCFRVTENDAMAIACPLDPP